MKVKLLILLIIFILISSYSYTTYAFTLVLDPGHGGVDIGATSDDGSNTHERDINLKIARYLKEFLSEYDNTNVLLTHNGFNDGELSVFDRSIFARTNKADLFVSLHINSYDGNPAKGAEIYVSANTSLPKYNENTTKLSEMILKNFASLGITSRGVKTRLIPTDETDVYSDGTRADYYGIIRYAMRGCKIDSGVIKGGTPANVQNGEGIPTILIEHCFIKGSDFTNFLNTDEKIKKLAEADGKAIVEYYGLKKKSEKIELEVDKNELYLLKDNNSKINAYELNGKNILYSSADSNIVTIDEKGNVKAINIGTTELTVKVENSDVSIQIPVVVSELEEGAEYKINNLKITDEILTKINEKTLITDFEKNIEVNEKLTYKISSKSEDYITTNTTVDIIDKTTNKIVKRYYCLIYGDTNNDGKVSAADYVLIKKHILKTKTLIGLLLNAGDVNRDGKSSAADYVIIKKHILYGKELKNE